jgi:acetoin utilization deacetylase AcuC-like enzyme
MGGYCFLNNAAVAAQTLRNQGFAKVAILDVDYHHGNGTQSIFYDRADVLFVSIHGDPRTEYPFYLGHADEAGEGEGLGFNLNLPLPAGSSKEVWFTALASACEKVKQFGADALAEFDVTLILGDIRDALRLRIKSDPSRDALPLMDNLLGGLGIETITDLDTQ